MVQAATPLRCGSFVRDEVVVVKIAYDQLDFIDERLRELMEWVEERWPGEPVVTSLFRPGDPGVHGTIPLRGVDLRMRDSIKGLELAQMINAVWVYDPDRPHMKCAIFHDVGQGMHMHLQVHPRTQFVHP